MKIKNARGLGLAAAALCCVSTGTSAHEIKAASDQAVMAAFDIIETRIVTERGHAIFRTRVRSDAGKVTPKPTGKFEGSDVYAYVWPTSLNSFDVGFEKDQGIVALAVTFHPDFDDAAYGGKNRDRWHPHWVVLNEDKAACPGGLKVKDIPEGGKPRLPETWPGAPILIDSPEYKTELRADIVEVHIPLEKIGALATASFDGVTAGLRVNANLHAPLLCVTNVLKIASGNLSLPGKVVPANRAETRKRPDDCHRRTAPKTPSKLREGNSVWHTSTSSIQLFRSMSRPSN